MTITEVIFSIPGLIAMTLIGPVLLGLAVITIRDIIGWTADTVQSFRAEPAAKPVLVAQNDHEPVSIQDAEALAFISSHPAMRFHRKRA